MRAYLSKEGTITLENIKSGPSRIIIPITRGFVEGSDVKAEVLPGSGDWILVCYLVMFFFKPVCTKFAQLDPSTNVAHLNVRVQARTSDGYILYVHYKGIMKIDEAAGKFLSWAPDAKSTEYGDHEWFSSPIVETNDPKLKWMETSSFVGQGHFVVEGTEGAVEYGIYKVVN